MPDGSEPDADDPDTEDFEPGGPEEREVAGKAALERSHFLQLMGHLYRGEMSRATTWRSRLDRTSNWAVVLVASLITFAFSTGNPDSIVLLGIAVVSLFLLIEARRYRMYDVWRSRVRLLEENVFANAAEPAGAEQREWRHLLSEDLRRPKIKVPLAEALARRLRRIYLALLGILLVAWLAHLAITAGSIWQAIPVAALGPLPGEVVFGIVIGYYVLLVGLAAWPMRREAKGELVIDEEDSEWKKERRRRF